MSMQEGQPGNWEIEKIALAEKLNAHFRDGGSAYEEGILTAIRRFPKPILIDLEETLVSTGRYLPNPLAAEALERARKTGSVFIISAIGVHHWDDTQTALKRAGLWKDNVVMLLRQNYESTDRYDSSLLDRANPVIQEFVRRNAEHGRAFNTTDLINGRKRVAPIFGKLHDIPLLDDNPSNTQNNPGILGIRVIDWSQEELLKQIDQMMRDEGMDTSPLQPTVLEAMDEVEKFYSKRVDNAFYLKVGLLYRLHVFERQDGRGVEVRTEDFYIEKPFDPEGIDRYGGRISVRMPDPNSRVSGDLYSSYLKEQLGMAFLHGTLMKQGKASPDKPPFAAFMQPGAPNPNNWVEEI